MHTATEKRLLLARARRIRGQMEGIERALESDSSCETLMHQIAGVRGALAGLMAEVVDDHIQSHLVDTQKHPNALDAEAAEQLMAVIRTYLK
jgi:DNA-binding FrmR family transcriptional regulator